MAYSKLLTASDLADRIEDNLKALAKINKIRLSQNSYGEMLGELLQGLCKRHGTEAVILIDEYDAPVSWNITDDKLAPAYVKVLHDFYTSIKTHKDLIRFALVTGITRFAYAAIESGANNFTDISLMPKFAGICGFTIKEFNRLFANRFGKTLSALKKAGDISQNADETTLVKKILSWHDGYNWLGKQGILNPFSIIKLFDKKRLAAYWPLSGIPSHLSQLASERPLEFIQPKLDSYLSQQIRMAELGKVEPASILFHSGYLTIDKRIHLETESEDRAVKPEDRTVKPEDEEDTDSEEAFILRIPNKEVGKHYKSFIFTRIFNNTINDFKDFTKKMIHCLLEANSTEIAKVLHDLLAGITFKQHMKAEKYYHSLFHAAFVGAGIEVLSETGSSKGQADMSLFLDGKIRVVIELKYRQANGSNVDGESDRAVRVLSSALDDAENAMKTKDYPGPFRANAKKIICLALAVRGRDEVAARFLDSAATLHRPEP
jgi:hypothetical protein